MNGGHFSASKDMNSYVCLTYPYQPSENNILRRESSPSPHPQIYHKVMTFRGSLHQAKIAVLFIGSVVAPWPHAYMEQILLRVVPPCQCWWEIILKSLPFLTPSLSWLFQWLGPQSISTQACLHARTSFQKDIAEASILTVSSLILSSLVLRKSQSWIPVCDFHNFKWGHLTPGFLSKHQYPSMYSTKWMKSDERSACW